MRTRAILFLAVLGISVAMMPTRAQQPGDQGRDGELMILQLRIDAEQARVTEAEARVNQAMRKLDRIERLNKHGFNAVSEGEIGEARDEVEIRKAQLQVQRIALKEAEVRLQQAKRSQTSGDDSPSQLDRRLEEMGDFAPISTETAGEPSRFALER